MKSFKLLTVASISLLTIMLALITKNSFAQPSAVAALPKTITVTGSAEMSIEPDEIELTITIHDDKNNFDKREKEISDICKKHGVKDTQLDFKASVGINGWYYWYWWWYYRNTSVVSQTYKLKISTKVNLLDLVKELNKSWVQNIQITSTTSKDLQVFRKEVKKEAMRMAKEKATYMLEAVDEKIGSIISVEEINADKNDKQFNGRPYPYYWYWDNPYYYGGYNSNMSNSSMNSNSVMQSSNVNTASGNSDNNSMEGVSKIKLRYEVKAVFQIQ